MVWPNHFATGLHLFLFICLPDDCFHSSSPTRCLLLDALAWWFCRWVCIVSVHFFSARCLLLGALAESFVLVFFSFFTPYALHLPRCCLLLGALGKWFCSGCACICTWCLGCLGRMILQYVCFHFLSLITRVVFFCWMPWLCHFAFRVFAFPRRICWHGCISNYNYFSSSSLAD